MARFANSNRHAARELSLAYTRRSRQARKPAYFQRIGFDAAML